MLDVLSDIVSEARKMIMGKPAPLVTVLRLQGVIGTAGKFQKSLTIENLAQDMEKAFSPKDLKAVALIINSPGGAVVQSAYIAGRIRALAREKGVPVLAFTEDVAASGGYMLALAGDEIFVHEASMIGSIGVISAGFGFPEFLEKFGVERRVYTAGEKKSILDPFRPENPDDIERLDQLLGDIHEFFKSYVRGRRGKRLKGVRSKIFSGDVFLGSEAIKLGLVDDIGEIRTVLRERFGDKVKIRQIDGRKRRFSSLFSLGRQMGGGRQMESGSSLPDQVATTLEERWWWSRYGL